MIPGDRMGMIQPSVSVIIPVYNDTEALAECLQALENQTYPGDRYDVIVVDNNSDDSPEQTVQGFRKTMLIYEIRQSSYAARNAGIRRSTADIVAFIDSDCLPDPEWIASGVRALRENPETAAVGGRVDFMFRDSLRPGAVELYDSITHFRQKDYIQKAGFSGAGNLFTRREILDEVGLFNEALISGGDYEWGRRLTSTGYSILYSDETRVRHPARLSLKEMFKKVDRVTGGFRELVREGRESRGQYIKILLMGLVPPVSLVLTVLRHSGIRGLLTNAKVILVGVLIQYARSYYRMKYLIK